MHERHRFLVAVGARRDRLERYPVRDEAHPDRDAMANGAIEHLPATPPPTRPDRENQLLEVLLSDVVLSDLGRRQLPEVKP
jgi:hypothetical protein